MVMDVESGEVLLRGQLASGAVACMSWAEEAAAAGGGAQPDGDGLLPHDGAARFCGAPAVPVPPPGRMAPQVRASIAAINLAALPVARRAVSGSLPQLLVLTGVELSCA